MKKFRFRGLDFPYNPRSIQIKRERRLIKLESPLGKTVVQDLGFQPAVISGEGELFGPEAESLYKELVRLYQAGGSGLLQIPGMDALFVYFSGLSVQRKAGPNLLRYHFSFVEDGGEAAE